MLNKTRAIVLRQIKYGESGLIVTLYTEKYGRLPCMVSGVRSKNTKFPATLFQSLSLLEVDFYYRENRELQRLKEAACPYHYVTIPFNILKSTITLFLSEVLYFTLREAEGNQALFSFLYHSFQLLDTMEKGVTNFHLWFMLQFSRFLGIMAIEPGFFSSDKVSSDMQHFYGIPVEAGKAMTILMDSPQGPPEDLRLSNRNRTLLLEKLIKHYAIHVDGFSKLKSFTILKEVFGQDKNYGL